ncbi:MAG: hypothetical protein PHR35_05325, partial [Kiritimatiellae bacterium]|nr:hypothetical protein [Kiritimatiellia bacterium]
MNRQRTNRGKVRKVMAAMAVTVIFGLSTSVKAAVILQDPMNGSSGDNLTGTTPASRGGIGTNAWNGSTDFKADGSVDAAAGSSGCIWLPFVPVAGNTYKVSAVLNTTSGGDYFLSMGFAQYNINPTVWNFADSSYTYGTVILPNNRGVGYGATYLGPGQGGAVSYQSPAGKVAFAIVLDATDSSSANWTLSFYMNRVLVRGPVALGSEIGINYVGFSNYANAGGTITGFQVESPATAEPL